MPRKKKPAAKAQPAKLAKGSLRAVPAGKSMPVDAKTGEPVDTHVEKLALGDALAKEDDA